MSISQEQSRDMLATTKILSPSFSLRTEKWKIESAYTTSFTSDGKQDERS